MKDPLINLTKEQLKDYRKRLQNYRISRKFFESLYCEGIIEEIDFYELNIKLIKKYRIPFNSVFNTKIKKVKKLIFDDEYKSFFPANSERRLYDNRSKEFNP